MSTHPRVYPLTRAGTATALAAALLLQPLLARAEAVGSELLPAKRDAASFKYLGDVSDDLTFTPVVPCRLADTRVAGGALGARSPRAFSATSASLIAAAGGNASGCSIPAGPAALALTITAVAPSLTGNLIAYADGATIPNASALNFLAGQIIANTTVVPSTVGSGNNFDLYNNSDGATPVTVDVVGYFYAPVAPDCTQATQTASAAASAAFNVTSACSAGYRITMGGCATTATSTGTDWRTSSFNATSDGWVCGGVNATGAMATISSTSYCCRNPGR